MPLPATTKAILGEPHVNVTQPRRLRFDSLEKDGRCGRYASTIVFLGVQRDQRRRCAQAMKRVYVRDRQNTFAEGLRAARSIRVTPMMRTIVVVDSLGVNEQQPAQGCVGITIVMTFFSTVKF